MKPNLDKLENLSGDQLEKISDDIDTIGIRQAAAQASNDTGRSIDKTTIQRLKERGIARRFLVESPNAAEAAAEILRFAVTGRPDFSEATIKVLEETAFKLSLECAEAEEDELKALNSITVMLARYRNASVRERMTKIQQDKLQLRREEFEWKKSLQGRTGAPPVPAGASPAKEEQSDDLGRLAKTLDDIERRAAEMFNQPCNGPTTEEPSPETPSLINTELQFAEPVGASHLSNTALQPGAPAAESRQTVSTVSPQPGSPPNPNGIPSSSPGLRGTSYPGLTDKVSSNPERVAAPGEINSSDVCPYLQSKKNSPCESSSQTSSETLSISPSAPSAVSKEFPPLSPVEKSAVQNSAICTLNSKTKSHAIRRWRAHIPFPLGAPEPDGSWRDECPCGNPAPCSEHPELKGRVRPYKPQHPDYQLGLKEFNVPYYKPTAEEIGCTQEALDRSCDLFANNPRMKDPPDPRFDPFNKTFFRRSSVS